MTDCPNVEIRELLPEFLNGTLSPSRQGEVRAHLTSCGDCAAELATIRLVREAYDDGIGVDVAAIVAALPRPSRARVAATRSWRHSHAFQIAAAVSFIALGGMSLAVARSFFGGDVAAGPDSVMVAYRGDSAADAEALPAISFAGGVSDLGDEDLESLLTALESIDALPVAEPSTVVLSGTERQGT